MSHTSTPWSTKGPFVIVGGNPEHAIAILDHNEAGQLNQANAAHIVTCVNNHDALVAALRQIEKASHATPVLNAEPVGNICRAALSRLDNVVEAA